MKNLPSAILGAQCGLCGVARDPTATTSAPASRSATPVGGGYRRAEPPLPSVDADPRVPCPICTFLNHRSMASCELCDSPLPSARSSTNLASTRSSTPLPAASSSDPFVRLSFRKGGEKTFYAQLKSALEAKEWDLDRLGKGRGRRDEESGAGIGELPLFGRVRGGADTWFADGILRGIDMDAKEREDSLEDALKDLDALMANAKSMVRPISTILSPTDASHRSSSLKLSTTASPPRNPPPLPPPPPATRNLSAAPSLRSVSSAAQSRPTCSKTKSDTTSSSPSNSPASSRAPVGSSRRV